MSVNYLDNQRKFISECEARGMYHLVKKPKHLPDHFAPDNDVYLIRSLLNEKFNRKFTEKEVIELLQGIPKKKKPSDDISLPQWYIDRWLKK